MEVKMREFGETVLLLIILRLRWPDGAVFSLSQDRLVRVVSLCFCCFLDVHNTLGMSKP